MTFGLFNRSARRASEAQRLARMAASIRPRCIGIDGAGDLITNASPASYQFQRLAEVSPAVRAEDDALAREIMRLSEAS